MSLIYNGQFTTLAVEATKAVEAQKQSMLKTILVVALLGIGVFLIFKRG